MTLSNQNEERAVEQWECPPPPDDCTHWSSRLSVVRSGSAALAEQYRDPPSTFGLELKAAYVALHVDAELSPADNRYWPVKCQSIFTRPAIEPILLSFWRQSPDLSMDYDAALKMTSVLAGYPVKPRREFSIGRSRNGDIHFEPITKAAQWIDDLKPFDKHKNMASNAPVYIFARTIMAHPFSDANGRLARTLFASALAKQMGLRTPCLAFAPSFYRYAERIADGMSSLSKSSNWQGITEVLLEVVRDAIAITEKASGLYGL